ncbi:hypothetical protein ACHAWF_005573 [Thalassiosira exigua]
MEQRLAIMDPNSNRDDVGGEKNPSSSCGAPFPPRPKSIATFLSSADFLPGCQTLLHSLKTNLAPMPKENYPPEITLLLSSTLAPKDAIRIRRHLCPIFCDRVVPVEHIPIRKPSQERNGTGDESSHVKSWDEKCGWTKLRLFELDGYETILYIDADCLVTKDVGHLLHIDDATHAASGGECLGNDTRTGLLAAAPDIFPPDKFNAGVMVLRPSKSVFREMMSRLPNSTPGDSTKPCTSYDGGDTGFLNSFYPGWFSDMPPHSRLPFGYNAQRFMHHCTYQKQPKYWDEAISDIKIIHFSSSPKPWDIKGDEAGDGKDEQLYLDDDDGDRVKAAKLGKLERMWQDVYEQSEQYRKKRLLEAKQSSKKKSAPHKAAPPQRSAATSVSAPASRQNPQSTHRMIHKRYKELRKAGMDTKMAMKTARSEYGLDKDDEQMDPSRAVGQMFGLV